MPWPGTVGVVLATLWLFFMCARVFVCLRCLQCMVGWLSPGGGAEVLGHCTSELSAGPCSAVLFCVLGRVCLCVSSQHVCRTSAGTGIAGVETPWLFSNLQFVARLAQCCITWAILDAFLWGFLHHVCKLLGGWLGWKAFNYFATCTGSVQSCADM